jgi:hypothetical protein
MDDHTVVLEALQKKQAHPSILLDNKLLFEFVKFNQMLKGVDPLVGTVLGAVDDDLLALHRQQRQFPITTTTMYKAVYYPYFEQWATARTLTTNHFETIGHLAAILGFPILKPEEQPPYDIVDIVGDDLERLRHCIANNHLALVDGNQSYEKLIFTLNAIYEKTIAFHDLERAYFEHYDHIYKQLEAVVRDKALVNL